jgi:hypothetical protein
LAAFSAMNRMLAFALAASSQSVADVVLEIMPDDIEDF